MRKRSLAALLAFSLVFSTVLPAAATDTAEDTGNVAAQEVQVSDPATDKVAAVEEIPTEYTADEPTVGENGSDFADDMIVDEEFSDETSAENQAATDIAAEPQLVIEDSEVVDMPATMAEGVENIEYTKPEDITVMAGHDGYLDSWLRYTGPDYSGYVEVVEYEVIANDVMDESGNWTSSEEVTIETIEYDDEEEEYKFLAKNAGRATVEVTYKLVDSDTETGAGTGTGTATFYIYILDQQYVFNIYPSDGRQDILPGETVIFEASLWKEVYSEGEVSQTSPNYTLKIEEINEGAGVATVEIGEDGETVLFTGLQQGDISVTVGAYLDGEDKPVATEECYVYVVEGYYEISVKEQQVPLGGLIDWKTLAPQLLYVTKEGKTPTTEDFRWYVDFDYGWERTDSANDEEFPQMKRTTTDETWIYLYAEDLSEDEETLASKSIYFDPLDYNISLTPSYGKDQNSTYIYTDRNQVFTLDTSGLPKAEYRTDWELTAHDENWDEVDTQSYVKIVSSNDNSITLSAQQEYNNVSVCLSATIYQGDYEIAYVEEYLQVKEAVCKLPDYYGGEYVLGTRCYFERSDDKDMIRIYVADSNHTRGMDIPAEIVGISIDDPAIAKAVPYENGYSRYIECIGTGSTTVTLTLKNTELWGDTTKQFTYTLTVSDRVYDFYFTNDIRVLFLDDPVQLKPRLSMTTSDAYDEVIPESDYKVTYSSSNPEEIEVTGSGLVTGKIRYGRATITAIAFIGENEVARISEEFYANVEDYDLEWGNLLFESGAEFTVKPTLTYYSKECKDGRPITQGVRYEITQDPEILQINGLNVKVPENTEGKTVWFKLSAYIGDEQKAGMSTTFTIRSGHEHTWDSGTITTPATVFTDAVKTCRCTHYGCTKTKQVSVPGTKLKPTVTLTATSLPMKKKQSTKKLVASGLALGDSLASAVSSNTKVVKVTSVNAQTGEIGLKAQNKTGKATLTIKLASGYTVTVKVKVQSAAVKTTKISGVPKKLTLKAKKSYTLKPVLKPITTQDKLKFTTSNKKVATVSKKGVIKAKKKGSATITVTCGKKKVKCKVKVTN